VQATSVMYLFKRLKINTKLKNGNNSIKLNKIILPIIVFSTKLASYHIKS